MVKFHDLFRVTDMKKDKYAALVIFNLLSGMMYVVYIDFIRKLISSVMHDDRPQIVSRVLWLVLSAALNILLKYWLNIKSSDMILIYEKEMKKAFFEKLNRVRLPVINGLTTADIITRFNEDINGIVEFVCKTLIRYAADMFTFAGLIIYVGLNNAYLLLFLLIAPLVIFISRHFGKKSGALYQTRQTGRTLLNEKAKDIFDFLDDIRLYRAQDFFLRNYETQEEQLKNIEKKIIFNDTITWVSNIMGYQMIYIFFYVFGGLLAFNGMFDFAVVVSLFTAIDRMIDMIHSLPGILPSWYKVKINIGRYDEIMQMEEECRNGIAISDCGSGYHISFENVTYAYPSKIGRHALDKISLDFQSCDRVAVIGRSGSGKSTLLRLLMGYDTEYQGDIRLGGRSIKEMTSGEIKRMISYLPQEVFLQNVTVADNIDSVLDTHITSEAYDEYAKLAALYGDFQMHDVLENGGENISGGQAQRLGIMMALMKKKPLLVLDECFSSVDPDTAAAILQNIFKKVNSGMVLVTHSINRQIMQWFDKIVLIEDGSIVAAGNYAAISQTAFYQSLEKEGER